MSATAADGSRTALAFDAVGRLVGVAPGIGDEVVAAFEEGGPYRPVVGMLWHDGDSVTLDTHGRLRERARTVRGPSESRRLGPPYRLLTNPFDCACI